jgi:O-antigen ligase
LSASISRIKYSEPALITAACSFIIISVISLSGNAVLPVLTILSFAILAAGYLIKKPEALIFGFFLLLPFGLENPEGVSIGELVFLGYTLLLTLFYFFIPFITGRLILLTSIDKLFLALTLFLPYASILGILNGADIYAAVGELTYFSAVFIYFALRTYISNTQFQKGVLFLLLLLIAYVIIRNAYNYQQIIIQAYAQWQIENARVASTEVLLLLCASLGTASFVVSDKFKFDVAALILTGIGILSLILTQSRGYWIAFAFSFILIFLFVSRRKKVKMVTYFSVLFILIIGAAMFFFPLYFDLVYYAIVERLNSIATSAKVDISVLERIDESSRVLSKIVVNPVVGYGLGTEYLKFIFFDRVNITTSYIHNGYLAAWYKFGLPGLILLLSICVMILRSSISIFKTTPHWYHRILSLTIIGTISGMLLVNNTSPQFLSTDSYLLFTLMGVYCSHFAPPRESLKN